jgi:hypothetical protein
MNSSPERAEEIRKHEEAERVSDDFFPLDDEFNPRDLFLSAQLVSLAQN